MNQPTLPPKSSGLPDRGIDRLFATLLAMYGKHWLDLWVDCDVAQVKAEWASALHGLDGECIRLALEHMRNEGKPFPPTQPEFVALCRRFVRRGAHSLALVDKRRGDGPKGGFDSLRNIIRNAGQ